MPVQDVCGDIRVELTKHGKANIARDRVGKLGAERAEAGSGRRIIGRRDRLGSDLAADPGEVERLTTGVGAGDDHAAGGVRQPLPFAARPHGVVSTVLVQNAWKDERGQVGVVRLVEEAPPRVSVVAAHAFPKDWVGILRLRGKRCNAEKDERGVVERLVRGDDEVSSKCRRRRNHAGSHAAVVGHDAKNAMRLRVGPIRPGGRSRVVTLRLAAGYSGGLLLAFLKRLDAGHSKCHRLRGHRRFRQIGLLRKRSCC